MPKEQKTDTREFKVEAVHLWETSQKSQAQIARELGVADSTLSQWRKDREPNMVTKPFQGAVIRRPWKKKIAI
ncbi:MAG TPA: transposase [Ktedonobacteraceae bacterium]|nr:transposase [Ktedonobacteraceae bacterium]